MNTKEEATLILAFLCDWFEPHPCIVGNDGSVRQYPRDFNGEIPRYMECGKL